MHFRTKATSETTFFRGDGGLSLTISIYRVAIKHCLTPFVKTQLFSILSHRQENLRYTQSPVAKLNSIIQMVLSAICKPLFSHLW